MTKIQELIYLIIAVFIMITIGGFFTIGRPETIDPSSTQDNPLS